MKAIGWNPMAFLLCRRRGHWFAIWPLYALPVGLQMEGPRIFRFSDAQLEPATSGATWLEIWWDRLVAGFGTVVNWLRIPGFVKDLDRFDEVSGQSIFISSSSRFTKISVNGRDYYFHRLTGRFDGAGSGCNCHRKS
jgi:hypothetical protein